jgi:hypothetical protein
MMFPFGSRHWIAGRSQGFKPCLCLHQPGFGANPPADAPQRGSQMQILIWIGVGLTLLGVALLFWCILQVVRARKSATSDEELRAKIQRVVALNLGALALSVLGLMIVVLGIFLG